MQVERPIRRVGRVRRLLLLLVASTFVTLGAIELLLRWNVIPNEYYLRNQVLGDPKGNGRFLLITGDSFFASHPGSKDVVDYLYSRLAPHGVRILNTAAAGTGPLHYLESLRREGARYRPNVVLLSYYVGNDLLDVGCKDDLDERLLATRSTPAWRRSYGVQFLRERLRRVFPGFELFTWTASGRPLLAQTRRASPNLAERASFHSSFASTSPTARPFTVPLRGVPAPVREQSHLLGVQAVVDYSGMKEAGIPEEYIESAKAGKLNPWVVSLGAVYPDYFRDALLVRSECPQRAWKDTMRVLDMILDEAATLDVQVLPVLFPHTFQVSTAHYALYRSWGINVDDEMLRTNRPQQLLREYFEAHGLEPLDLLDAFRAHDEMLYWDEDEHLNPRGQQLAARLIAEAFLARYEDDGVR